MLLKSNHSQTRLNRSVQRITSHSRALWLPLGTQWVQGTTRQRNPFLIKTLLVKQGKKRCTEQNSLNPQKYNYYFICTSTPSHMTVSVWCLLMLMYFCQQRRSGCTVNTCIREASYRFNDSLCILNPTTEKKKKI